MKLWNNEMANQNSGISLISSSIQQYQPIQKTILKSEATPLGLYGLPKIYNKTYRQCHGFTNISRSQIISIEDGYFSCLLTFHHIGFEEVPVHISHNLGILCHRMRYFYEQLDWITKWSLFNRIVDFTSNRSVKSETANGIVVSRSHFHSFSESLNVQVYIWRSRLRRTDSYHFWWQDTASTTKFIEKKHTDR